MQQHNEQVDEIEIQPQRAGNGEFAGCFFIMVFVIFVFDVLGVVGGKTDEDQDTDYRNSELQR